MKIGYLLQQGVDVRQPPFDGPANHVREVVLELERLGHPVRLLAHLDGRLWVSDGLQRFRPVVVRAMDRGPLRLLERLVRRVQYELRLPYGALFESVRFALACRQELGDRDLFYERMSWMGLGGALAGRWLGIPLVLENNGDHLADLEAKGIAPRGLQRRLSLAVTGRAVRWAAHVVVSGAGWRNQFVGRWQISDERLTTIENGTALLRLLERNRLQSFRPEARSRLELVYLGGFYPWHGVPVLLQAVANALAQGVSLQLRLVGAGSGLEEARRLTQTLGLGEVVSFAGQLDAEAFAPLLAAADVGLAPYCGWQEFSGLKLFDYKAAGLAIIASGRDGQPATLRHEQTALIVPPCDAAALTAAIVRLAEDAPLRRQMGQAARLEAESQHGWDHTVRQIEWLFDEVVTHAAARPGQAGRRPAVI